MSSPDFKIVNIVDSSLEDITSNITVPCITGASALSFQTFTSSNPNTSQIIWNVQVPSISTCVDRQFLMEVEYDLLFTFANTGANYYANDAILFQYGSTNALQAFPLNSIINTVNLQLNDTTVTSTTSQIKSALLKLYNYEELAKYNSLTPTLPDSFYQDYQKGLLSNNNPLGNFSNGSYDKAYLPRGVFPVKLLQNNAANTPIDGYTISADGTGTVPYNSFIIRVKTTEPILFCSPLISSDSNTAANLLGINNLVLTLNLLSNAERGFSNASYALNHAEDNSVPTIQSVNINKINSARLLMKFKTIPPTLMNKIEPKNVLNHVSYTSYPMTNSIALAAEGGSATISFTNVQLNQVPSKIIIYARPKTLTSYQSDYFLTLSDINITFNVVNGLLSGSTPQQLYEMSKRNLLQMNYYEFSGKGVSNATNVVAGVSTVAMQDVATIGSIIVIDPAIDLSLATEYTNGSSGQFNLTFQMNVKNQTSTAITAADGFVVYCVVQNTGLFVCENGKSQVMLGLLNKETVLDAKSKDAITDTSTLNEEILGGSISNTNSIHKHLKNLHKDGLDKEMQMDDNIGNSINDNYNASGMSAGVMSGGRMSAGRMSGGASGIIRQKLINRFHKNM